MKKKELFGIAKWPEEERPREKLLSKSPQHLNNAELLAIILNCGSRYRTCIDLATDILKITDNDLAELANISPQQLMSVYGIAKARAVKVSACLELGRRQQAALPKKIPVVNAAEDAAFYLGTHFSHYPHEIFGVLFLNNANKVKGFSVISEGGITGTIVDVRIVLKKALDANATKLILGHNHPSGNLQPSKADKDLTGKIKTAADLLDIKVIDHLIITNNGYFSFANEGLLGN